MAYCSALPDNDFECLAYAQHYGLATRLLDWTANPLVALYFAAETRSEVDGAVYCHLGWNVVVSSAAQLDGIPCVATYEPRPFDRRILAQAGRFTYHPIPQQAIVPGKPHPEAARIAPDGTDLARFIVKSDLKRIILRQLSEVGVSRKALFPDLEGLSEFVNWETRRFVN